MGPDVSSVRRRLEILSAPTMREKIAIAEQQRQQQLKERHEVRVNYGGEANEDLKEKDPYYDPYATKAAPVASEQSTLASSTSSRSIHSDDSREDSFSSEAISASRRGSQAT